MSESLSLASSMSRPKSQPVLEIKPDGSFALKKLEPAMFCSYVRRKPESALGPNTFEILLSDDEREGDSTDDYDYSGSDAHVSDDNLDSDEEGVETRGTLWVHRQAMFIRFRDARLPLPRNLRHSSARSVGASLPPLHHRRARFHSTLLSTIPEEVDIAGNDAHTGVQLGVGVDREYDADTEFDADTEDEQSDGPEDPNDWSDEDEAAVNIQVGAHANAAQQFPFDEIEDSDEEDLRPEDAPFVFVPSDYSRSDPDSSSTTWADRRLLPSGSVTSSSEEVVARVQTNEDEHIARIRRIRAQGPDAQARVNEEIQCVLVERELGYF